MAESIAADMAAGTGMFTSLNISVKKEQTENETRLLTSEPAPSDVLLPAKLHHLNLPKENLQLGPSAQVPSTMGGIFHSNHHSVLQIVSQGPIGTL